MSVYYPTVDGIAELTDELAGIAGVEGAEFAVGDSGVTGVRVRLEADADADGVGRAVQEVMVRHGVRARLGTAQPPAPPSTAAPVVSLAGRVSDRPEPSPDDRITGVAVAESARGLEVSVTSESGNIVTERTRSDDEAIAEAVTIATAELFGSPGAVLLEFRRDQIAEADVVTVVIAAAGGARSAGSAVVGAGFPFAVARAVWSALGA